MKAAKALATASLYVVVPWGWIALACMFATPNQRVAVMLAPVAAGLVYLWGKGSTVSGRAEHE